jgi:ABC-2 type transport system ATP-binding protein
MVQAFREALESLRKQGDTTVFLSSHVLTEVETTCDRVGVIRGGHLVATGTIADLKRSAARRITVEFRDPVGLELPAIPGAAIVHRSDRRWVLTMQGPAGPLVRALADLPVHDVEIEPFRLEDYVARHYSEN